MDESSKFQRGPIEGPAPQWELGDLAEAADIPQPSSKALESELGSQARRKDREDFGSLPRNLLEAVRMVEQMERQGRRVERNSGAMMDFLKTRHGDTLSADLLAATALLMAAVPERRKEKKQHLLSLYFRWARDTTTALIHKVLDNFKDGPGD